MLHCCLQHGVWAQPLKSYPGLGFFMVHTSQQCWAGRLWWGNAFQTEAGC